MTIKEAILETLDFEDTTMFADGYDDAIVGFEINNNVVVYSIDKMVDLLVEDGMDELEAFGHLEYNVINAYVGEQTPKFIRTYDYVLQSQK